LETCVSRFGAPKNLISDQWRNNSLALGQLPRAPLNL